MKKDPLAELVVGRSTDKKLLTPQQKEFNRLTAKITETRERLHLLTEMSRVIVQRASLELHPLQHKYQRHRAETVRLLDRMFRAHKFTRTELQKLRQAILEMSFDLIQDGFDDLKEIYNQYTEDLDYDEAQEKAEESARKWKAMMMDELMEADEDEPASEPPAAEKPKSAKQAKAEAKRAAREEKEKQEEKKISQTVREVYMDLVKAFHPDLEPDEAEKIRKTAILQRVTAAYEDNDLLALLQLQLELERIDGNHLDNLADDKLRYFNKSLLVQLSDLIEELRQIEIPLARMANLNPFGYFKPEQIEMEFERSLKAMKKQIKSIKQDLESLRDPVVLRDWLRYFRAEEDGF